MAITTTKVWTVECDGTTADGRPSCYRNTLAIRAGDESEWTGPIFNRGQLDTHLRRTGWSVGRFVLCPACAGGGA